MRFVSFYFLYFLRIFYPLNLKTLSTDVYNIVGFAYFFFSTLDKKKSYKIVYNPFIIRS